MHFESDQIFFYKIMKLTKNFNFYLYDPEIN